LLPLTNGLQVTFHRAFDELEDQIAGLRTLSHYPQIKRVLTSAGPGPAMEAIPAMRGLVQESQGGSVKILAGSGLKPQGIQAFIEQTGVTEVHFGSAVRIGNDSLSPIDPAVLRALAESLRCVD
jgi:copper homeostasis protein